METFDDEKPKGGVKMDPNSATNTMDSKDTEALTDSTHTDMAYGMYKESLMLDPDVRDKAAKRVLLKLDFIVLPMVRLSSQLSPSYEVHIPDSFSSDGSRLLPQLLRQALIELRGRIRSPERSPPPRQRLLLGSFHLELGLPHLRLPFGCLAAKVPCGEIYRRSDADMGCSTDAHRVGQQLLGADGLAVLSGWRRSWNRTGVVTADECFLEQGRGSFSYGVVAGL